jgi:predicted metallo-beta-lactamase superfamily hydrolase
LEYRARNECRARIREYALKADVTVISHYHNDHHTPNYTETIWLGSSQEESKRIYENKTVLAKDFRNAINVSQRRRGWMFQQFLKRIGSKCEVADGQTFEYGATRVKFSPPVPHGEEKNELGYLVMTFVESGGQRVLHASDVQGPISKQTARMIAKFAPDLAIVGGPPLYLEGFKIERESIRKGIENAAKLTKRISTLILEHHLLRSENWRKEAQPVFDSADRYGHRVLTAAEYLGLAPNLLEFAREQLYEQDPPSEEFLKWCTLPREKRRLQPPPFSLDGRVRGH